VLKVGGSLASTPAALKGLCAELGRLAKKYRLAVVPGGGIFADVVRVAYLEFSLPQRIAHEMAVMGMDQYGYLLYAITPNSRLLRTLAEAGRISAEQKLPIFQLSGNRCLDGLERSWRVTSDSIAARVAQLLGARKLLLLKDVDGVLTRDPKKYRGVRLRSEVTLAQLPKVECVDPYLATVLRRSNFETYIVNGRYPSRVEAILNGERATSTRVLPVHRP